MRKPIRRPVKHMLATVAVITMLEATRAARVLLTGLSNITKTVADATALRSKTS